MIYILEFFKGASFALALFGAFFLFLRNNCSFFYLFIGLIPGFLLFVICVLMIKNYELNDKLKPL